MDWLLVMIKCPCFSLSLSLPLSLSLAAQEGDAGDYTCQAVNVVGTKEETFHLQVLGVWFDDFV